MTKTDEREIYKRFYVMTKAQRQEAGFPLTQSAMLDYLQVSSKTLTNWDKEFMSGGIFPPKKTHLNLKTTHLSSPEKTCQLNPAIKEVRELPEEMKEVVEDITTIVRGWWTREKIDAVNEAIFLSSIGEGKGNANSQKLASDLAGELKKDKEIKFALSADQYFAIRRDAASRIQQLSGESNGTGGVLSKPPILLPEDGVSTEQEHIQEGEVAALAVSA